MGLINPKSRAEAQREVVLQERKRAIIERGMRPRIARAINKSAINAAGAYENFGQMTGAMIVMQEAVRDMMSALVPAFLLIADRSVAYVFNSAGLKASQEETVERLVREWILSYALLQSKTITATTRQMVRDAIVEGIADGLGEVAIGKLIIQSTGGQVATQRARLIARTEAHNVSQKAIQETVKNAELPEMLKRWIPTADDRTRDGHSEMISHKAIPLNERFRVVGKNSTSIMDRPGDSMGSAENVINCRCVLVYQEARLAR